MSAKGLGKGFDILMPLDVDIAGVTSGNQEKVHKLAVDVVVPKKDQPRSSFDEVALKELAQSIREYGIIQPLIVRQIKQNLYSIIAGERRWRAAQIAGLKEVPAIIRSATQHEQLELSLLENVQRADLTAIEKANAIFRLHTQFNQKYEDIARRLGKDTSTVINVMRLLGLPAKMQEALQTSVINEGHARALLSIQKFPKEQQKLLEMIIAKHLNVRQAEQFVISVKRANGVGNVALPKKVVADDTAVKIQKYLGAKQVFLQRSHKGSGKIIIHYSSEDELTKIVDHILEH